MKIVVVSDTHGNQKNFLKMVEREKPIDLIFHCGDACGGEYTIMEAAGCPVEMVAGNSDYFSPLEEELEFEVEGKKVLLTHGHHYYVSTDPGFIRKDCVARGIDLLCYGHTHIPEISVTEQITVVNPGSLTYPRQPGRIPTYAVLMIDSEGNIKAQIKEMES